MYSVSKSIEMHYLQKKKTAHLWVCLGEKNKKICTCSHVDTYYVTKRQALVIKKKLLNN